jgi:hypothetical protein
MDDMEKLAVLLPHWIEHNQEHSIEFENWAIKASDFGKVLAAEKIRNAVEALLLANKSLQEAQTELGIVVHSDHHNHSL